VDKIIKKIKQGDFNDIYLHEVNFDLVVAEKKAKLYERNLS